jgi:hypothetical protein
MEMEPLPGRRAPGARADRESVGSPTLTVADPVSFWLRLRELAARLYPTGPRENDIWRTAGGDLSRLELSDTGYTQWARAVRKLEQGGGGDSNPQKLLAAMLQEFPNNPDLQYLQDLAARPL